MSQSAAEVPLLEWPPWLLEAMAELRKRLPPTFVGRLEVNCYRGNIANINVLVSLKPPADL